MNERIKWLEYKGKKILYCDFSHLDIEDLIKQIDALIETMKTLPRDLHLLDIANVSDTYILPRVKEKFDELANVRNTLKGGTAVIGLTGPQRIIANLIKKDLHFVKSMEDAKEWLIKRHG